MWQLEPPPPLGFTRVGLGKGAREDLLLSEGCSFATVFAESSRPVLAWEGDEYTRQVYLAGTMP